MASATRSPSTASATEETDSGALRRTRSMKCMSSSRKAPPTAPPISGQRPVSGAAVNSPPQNDSGASSRRIRPCTLVPDDFNLGVDGAAP